MGSQFSEHVGNCVRLLLKKYKRVKKRKKTNRENYTIRSLMKNGSWAKYQNAQAKHPAEGSESRLPKNTQFNSFCCFSKYINPAAWTLPFKDLLLKRNYKRSKYRNVGVGGRKRGKGEDREEWQGKGDEEESRRRRKIQVQSGVRKEAEAGLLQSCRVWMVLTWAAGPYRDRRHSKYGKKSNWTRGTEKVLWWQGLSLIQREAN